MSRPAPGGRGDRAPATGHHRPGRAADRGFDHAADRGSGRGTDRGSATAELAVGLPALLVLLFAGLVAVGAVTTKLQCVDAARDAALAAARGEPGTAVGDRSAPAGADVSVMVDGDTVTATVRAPVPMLGGHLPGRWVSASAVAAVEPGSPGPVP